MGNHSYELGLVCLSLIISYDYSKTGIHNGIVETADQRLFTQTLFTDLQSCLIQMHLIDYSLQNRFFKKSL